MSKVWTLNWAFTTQSLFFDTSKASKAFPPRVGRVLSDFSEEEKAHIINGMP